MGVFLQTALFPGCAESIAREAVETAAKNSAFQIDPQTCRYAQSYEGTQVLMEGDCLGFAALARALSNLSENPVMLLYIYDGDFWGYDFYGGKEEDHFRTRPDAFGPVSPREKQRLSGNPAALSGWLPTWDTEMMGRYLVHWSDLDEEAMEETACPGDQFPYGDCWQMTDFMARLGFPWAFDQVQEAPPLQPDYPKLREILERELPPVSKEVPSEGQALLDKLPSALSFDYIRHLLEEDGVREFGFLEKTPPEIVEAVKLIRWTVKLPETNYLCQRLAVLAAFCAFWLRGSIAWGLLDWATYEPRYGSFPKPTDVYVLRARAALTDYSKRHRAWRDLERLIELDPDNQALYEAEIQRWKAQERARERDMSQYHETIMQEFAEKKRKEEEREARRLQLILEKRRKGKK